MSQENVEVALRWIEAFNRQDRITEAALWRSDAVGPRPWKPSDCGSRPVTSPDLVPVALNPGRS